MTHAPLNIRMLFMVIVILSQVFLYGLRWWTADVLTTDFPYFYTVARLYQTGQNPYDLRSQCRFQASIRPSECAGYAHTPILLPLLGFLFNDDYVASYWRWAVFQILLLSISLTLLYSISKEFLSSFQCLLFPSVITGLWFGNDTSFILTAILGWVWLLSKHKDVLAGLSLSLVIIKPQLALPVAIPLLFVRPKAFMGFFIGGLALTLYSFAIVGIEGFRGIIEVTRLLSTGNTFGGVSQAEMVNTTGILARAGISAIWAWPIYGLSIAAVSLFLKKKGLTLSTVSFAIIVTLFTSPYLFFYDLAYLVVPLIYVHPLAPALASLMTAMYIVPGFPAWPIYLIMGGLAYSVLKKGALASTLNMYNQLQLSSSPHA